MKNYKGHIIKIWESNSPSCNLALIPWTTGIYLFSKQEILWAKGTNFFFFILMSLLSYHLRLKKSFHWEESYLTLEWHDKITSWTASEVGSQKFRRDEHWFLWKLVQAYCPYIENITQNIQNMHTFFPRSKHQCFP